MIRDAIEEALGAVSWGSLVDAGVRDLCARHAQQVLEVNETMNLTRITDPREIALKHVLDAFWIVPALDGWDRDNPQRYLDFGSGAGWPFVPLAAYFGCEAVACEKTLKKARFLKTVCGELLPKAQVFAKQVHDLRQARFDLVTSRAVGPLDKIFDASAHTVASGGVWAAYKGPGVEEELKPWRTLLKSRRFRELPLVETALPDGALRLFVGAVSR